MPLPVGHHDLHPHPSINFQLNRLLPGADHDEVVSAATRVSTLPDWKRVMLTLARQADSEARWLHASSYYRAAEFYMLPGDPAKAAANELFLARFDRAIADLPHERLEVPYAAGALPVLRLPAEGARRDTLVVHGGFDSYLEELVWSHLDFPAAGIEVVLFDGPGQGQALRRHGLTMDPAWEKPVAAVLDALSLDRCTLMGWSLGGYLAPRAAAFEPRIERLIVDDVLDDFLDCFAATPEGLDTIGRIEALLDGHDTAALDALATALMDTDEVTAWVFRHGMAVCGASRPAELFAWMRALRTAPFAERITQDVLVLGASEDHIVPRRQFHRQLATLTKASSLTAGLFTAADDAQAHCHVGNLGLISRFVRGWIEFQLEAAQARAVRRAAAAA